MNHSKWQCSGPCFPFASLHENLVAHKQRTQICFPGGPSGAAGTQQGLCSATNLRRSPGHLPWSEPLAEASFCWAGMDLLASQRPSQFVPIWERGQWWPWSPRPGTRFSTKYSPPSTSCFGGWPSSIVPHLDASRSQSKGVRSCSSGTSQMQSHTQAPDYCYCYC